MPLKPLNHLTKSKAIQHILSFLFRPPLPSARSWWRVITQWATPSEMGVRTFTPWPQMSCLNSWERNVTAPRRTDGAMEPSTSMFALTSYRGARSGGAKFPKLPSGDAGPPTNSPPPSEALTPVKRQGRNFLAV